MMQSNTFTSTDLDGSYMRVLRRDIHDGFPVHSHAADAEIIFIVLAGSHNGPPQAAML